MQDHIDRLRNSTDPYDLARHHALDRVQFLASVPGYTDADVWRDLADDEREAVADLWEEDEPMWTEDDGSEGW